MTQELPANIAELPPDVKRRMVAKMLSPEFKKRAKALRAKFREIDKRNRRVHTAETVWMRAIVDLVASLERSFPHLTDREMVNLVCSAMMLPHTYTDEALESGRAKEMVSVVRGWVKEGKRRD